MQTNWKPWSGVLRVVIAGTSTRECVHEVNNQKRLSALILDKSKFSQNFKSKSRVEQR